MKSTLVLARNDTDEAMRVAAGLTIFGHDVSLVVLASHGEIPADNEFLEVLELAEIEPLCIHENTGAAFRTITVADLGDRLAQAQAVLSF